MSVRKVVSLSDAIKAPPPQLDRQVNKLLSATFGADMGEFGQNNILVIKGHAVLADLKGGTEKFPLSNLLSLLQQLKPTREDLQNLYEFPT